MGGRRRQKAPKKRRRRPGRRVRKVPFSWVVAAVILSVIFLGLGWMALRPATPSPTPIPTKPAQVTPTPTPFTPPPAAVVGIVDQFYSQSPSFTDQALKFLKSQGISVKVHKDREVTVKLYRELPTYGYRLIILRVHAGVCERLEEHPTFLFTTEEYTTSRYIVEQLTEQIMSGVIDPNRPENPVFTVGPMFVRISMKGNFKGATIILSSCLGLYNKYLAEAFIKRGARVFISWDEKVSLGHTDRATLVLLKALVEEKATIKEAVEKVMTEVGSDPLYGCILRYYPPEVGNHHPFIAS